MRMWMWERMWEWRLASYRRKCDYSPRFLYYRRIPHFKLG